MSKEIDFYFDFSSPYGYFASTAIDALAAKYQRKVNWHPVLLGAIFKVSGGAPLTTIPLKGEYSLRDFERTARFHGIPFNQPPTFPIATQSTARAMLWVRQAHNDDKAREFAKAAYHAFFVDGIDINDPANLQKIAAQIGIDGVTLVEGLNSPNIKEQLKQDVEHAMQRKVFGSPYIIVDGEPFWGFDRFEQLEAFLKTGSI